MAKERFKLIPSVYVLIEKDGKTLLSRRFQTGFEDGKYGLVSGHAEGGETLRQALSREVKEEIGITIDVSNLSLVHTMHRWCGDHERVDFFFVADKWQGEIVNMEPNKCDDLAWFSIKNIPENTVGYIKQVITNWQSKIPYSEWNWPN